MKDWHPFEFLAIMIILGAVLGIFARWLGLW